MPIPQYQRQQKADEARGALKRLVPELQPQTAPGGLAKTQWEIDNGYPHGYSWEYIPLHLAEDAADMESSPIPEELRTQKSSRLTAIRHGILQRQDARAADPCAQTPETSPGQQSPEQAQRYEQSSPIQSSTAPLHNNVPRSRIGTARERFMTSNSKGQLVVGIAADIPSVTGQVPQNPGFIRQFAELGCCSQPEAPRAVEEEPEQSLPEDLKPAEGLEPDTNVVVLERSKRKRRPSARARESLQYALEMERCTETISEKLQGNKARPSKPKRKAGETKGSKGSQGSQGSKSPQDSQGGSKPTQEADAKEAAAAGTAAAARTAVTLPRVQTRSSLARSYAAAEVYEPSLPVVIEAPRLEGEDQCQCIVPEPGQSESEISTACDIQQRPCRRRNCRIRRSENHFGMMRGEHINARPPPVSAAECAWAAEDAEFAVEAVQACYALTADRTNTELPVPRQHQIDQDVAQAAIVSREAEYTRIERLHRSENGPIARIAEFAGVTDTAIFAIHAIEASIAFQELWSDLETDDESEEQQSQLALE
ncbi:hypothetical protein TrVGV298_010853 [Trichoderma virens]|nr:hypothetical protein TrVGV298_010853 [Trichoderma virens]